MKAILLASTNNSSSSTHHSDIVKSISSSLSSNGWSFRIIRSLIIELKDEVVVIDAIEDAITSNPECRHLYNFFRYILQVLYDSGKLYNF